MDDRYRPKRPPWEARHPTAVIADQYEAGEGSLSFAGSFQATARNASTQPSQRINWFQLTLFWATISKSLIQND